MKKLIIAAIAVVTVASSGICKDIEFDFSDGRDLNGQALSAVIEVSNLLNIQLSEPQRVSVDKSGSTKSFQIWYFTETEAKWRLQSCVKRFEKAGYVVLSAINQDRGYGQWDVTITYLAPNGASVEVFQQMHVNNQQAADQLRAGILSKLEAAGFVIISDMVQTFPYEDGSKDWTVNVYYIRPA